jgi:catechol 2,3-dioxygenase-like lactoylglutathione lyase family enzyme
MSYRIGSLNLLKSCRTDDQGREFYSFLHDVIADERKESDNMKYSSVVIAVNDIKASRTFYEDLFGLELFQDYGRNIVFRGGLSLQQDFDWLVSIPKEKVLKEPNNMELCFEEEMFDTFLQKLENYGVRYLGEVVEHGWGQRAVRFYDPDGHLIEVGEDMKMVVKRFLASGFSMAETAKRMDVSLTDLEELMNS